MDSSSPSIYNTEWGMFFTLPIKTETCIGCLLFSDDRNRPCRCDQKGFQCTWHYYDTGESKDIHFQVKKLKEKTCL